jgi:hypothetical protein
LGDDFGADWVCGTKGRRDPVGRRFYKTGIRTFIAGFILVRLSTLPREIPPLRFIAELS